MQRLRTATTVGLCGALAVIIGTVLPWFTLVTPDQGGPDSSFSSPAQSATFNGLVAGSFTMMFLGIGVGIAAGWLWAGDQPRKAIAALAPVGTAVVAVAVWVMTAKGQVLGFGPMDTGETVSLKVGIYTTLAGGILALIAAGLALRALTPSDQEEAEHLDADAIEA